ncbi:glycoside hydrolase family 93 protein [Venturia nashicola]|uniref:Glycoside hydrolase family 93 protein n=1 Tax=Venturia nashicola TaxID=86259 RepID=A0A4Z1PAK9_9PEZI|nr:glycoside hydrolase family 93 protein [Venturia nashicola]
MFFGATSFLLSLASFQTLVSGAVSSEHVSEALPSTTIFTPPSSYKIPRTLYARTLLTSDKTLLATWENYGPEPPYFPIYQSRDDGKTWSEIGRVKDQKWGWGMRYQPFLYELPREFGDYPAGTILAAGSAIPADLSVTQLELYASKDKGKTWHFVSHVAKGGKAQPNNDQTPVWEPFLMMDEGKLVYYYSDQRRNNSHGQLLTHQVTRDLRTWDAPVDDVVDPRQNGRPGMTTIARLPNGKHILTYEWVNPPSGNGQPVHFRLSANPLKFDSAPDYALKAQDGTVPNGSPYVVWTPAGGANGTIVVSCGSRSEVFINRGLAAPGTPWIKVSTPAPVSYSRSLLVMSDPKYVLITGGGVLNGASNKVTAVSIDVSK